MLTDASQPHTTPADQNGLVTEVCPRCRGELVSAAVDADLGLTRCQGCNARFELSSLARTQGRPLEAPSIQRRRVAMPSFTAVDRHAGGLQLRVRFFRGVDALMAFAYVIVSGAVFLNAVTPSRGRGALPPETALVVVVAFVTGYVLATRLLNSRRIDLTPDQLSVRVGPIPWPGRLDIRTAELSQLFCVTKVHHRKGVSYSYEVHAVLKNGRQVEIVKELNTLQQALWLEQEIEKSLGIRDEHVPESSGSWSEGR